VTNKQTHTDHATCDIGRNRRIYMLRIRCGLNGRKPISKEIWKLESPHRRSHWPLQNKGLDKRENTCHCYLFAVSNSGCILSDSAFVAHYYNHSHK